MTPEQEGAELAAWTEWARTADEPFLPWRVWLARAEIAAADKARIAALEAEVQALRVDAQRYRFWRNCSTDMAHRLGHYGSSELDIAIDAARAAGVVRDEP